MTKKSTIKAATKATLDEYVSDVQSALYQLGDYGVELLDDEAVPFLNKIDPETLPQVLEWLALLIQQNHARFAPNFDAYFLEDGDQPNTSEPEFVEMTPADEADILGEAV